MGLLNVSEASMIAVVSVFGPELTALREVINNISPYALTFLLH